MFNEQQDAVRPTHGSGPPGATVDAPPDDAGRHQLAIAVQVGVHTSHRFARTAAAARLRVADQVVEVVTDEAVLIRQGRFDTALAWRAPSGEREVFRLSCTDGQQIDLTVASARVSDIESLERWLRLDK